MLISNKCYILRIYVTTSIDNDQRALPLFVTLQAPPIRQNLTIDEARHKQDAALRILRLHRYKIPEDGNCMFRAVASQLRLDQDRVHPILREAASDWADLHVEDLLASLLVDGVDEVLMSVSLTATLSLSISLTLSLSLTLTHSLSLSLALCLVCHSFLLFIFLAYYQGQP